MLPMAAVKASWVVVLNSERKFWKAAVPGQRADNMKQDCCRAALTQLGIIVDRRLHLEERHCCGLCLFPGPLEPGLLTGFRVSEEATKGGWGCTEKTEAETQ